MNMKGYQLACMVLLGSLFAVTGLRQYFVEPLDAPFANTAWFVIEVLPLLAVLPGVLRGTPRGYLLAALAALLYFVHGTVEAATPDHRMIALWEVGFAVALVGVAGLAVRRLS